MTAIHQQHQLLQHSPNLRSHWVHDRASRPPFLMQVMASVLDSSSLLEGEVISARLGATAEVALT